MFWTLFLRIPSHTRQVLLSSICDTLNAFKVQQAVLGFLHSAFHSNSPLSSPGFTIKHWDITKTWLVGLSLFPTALKICNFWSPQGPTFSITQRSASLNFCRQEGKVLQPVASVTEVRIRHLMGKNKWPDCLIRKSHAGCFSHLNMFCNVGVFSWCEQPWPQMGQQQSSAQALLLHPAIILPGKPSGGATHRCSQGGSQVFMCSGTKPWAQHWGWDIVFPGHPWTTPAFILFCLQPGDVFPIPSYACPSTLHPSQGHIHYTDPRHFLLPPGLSSHPFPLLLLFTDSCQMPLPPAFRDCLEASLPLTTNPQSSTISRG